MKKFIKTKINYNFSPLQVDLFPYTVVTLTVCVVLKSNDCNAFPLFEDKLFDFLVEERIYLPFENPTLPKTVSSYIDKDGKKVFERRYIYTLDLVTFRAELLVDSMIRFLDDFKEIYFAEICNG